MSWRQVCIQVQVRADGREEATLQALRDEAEAVRILSSGLLAQDLDVRVEGEGPSTCEDLEPVTKDGYDIAAGLWLPFLPEKAAGPISNLASLEAWKHRL